MVAQGNAFDYITHYYQDGEVFDYVEDVAYRPDDERRKQSVLSLCGAKRGQWLLDVGSGSGWFSQAMVRRGVQVIALDLSRRNLKRLQNETPAVFPLFADSNRLPLKNESLDWVAAIEVIEHLVHPLAALNEFRRVLKPGGYLLICVPYRERLVYNLCIHCNQLTPKNAHLHSFDLAKLIDLLQESGFTYHHHRLFLNKGISLLRLNSLWGWLPFPLWRGIDGLANRWTDKAMYIGVVARNVSEHRP